MPENRLLFIRPQHPMLRRIVAGGSWVAGICVLVEAAWMAPGRGDFAQQIGLLPFAWAARQSGTIAWIWAAALLPLGLACLFRLHARPALWGSGALLLGAAGVWRWAGACGCVVRLPAAAWVESAAMVVGAAAWL